MAERMTTPARVLLVMELPHASVIAFALTRGPFVTRATASASDARDLLTSWRPEMYIVDVDDPGGIEMARGRPSGVPFIALTSRRDVSSRLDAFEHGADDVLVLPVDPEELLARTLALLRRTYGRKISFDPAITVGTLKIDVARGAVSVNGSTVHLTPIEVRLLYVLAATGGETLSRQRILDILWGVDFVADSNVIDRHIKNLRAKLGDDPKEPRFIRTVAGEGYAFAGNRNDRQQGTKASKQET